MSDDVAAAADGGVVTAGVPLPKEEAGFGTLLLPLLIGQLLVTADLTCMNSLNSTIAHDLGSSLTGITTAISLSLLVAGALIVPASRIGDRRGHARVMALGAALLAVGDAVTALSPSLGVLMVGKALIAATGAALILPAVFSLATLNYEGATRARALGLISAQIGVGGLVGGLGAGLMATNASWRAWFWVEVAVGIVLVVMMRSHFAERLHPRVAEFDFPGAVLSFVGLALVVLGFLQASAFGFATSRQDFHLFGVKLLNKGGIAPTLPMVGLGLLTLVAFALVERRRIAHGKEPLVHLSVLGERAVRAGGIALALCFLILGSLLFVVPTFGLTTLGWTASKAGSVIGLAAIALVVGALAVSRVLAGGRVTARTFAIASFATTLVASVALAFAFSPSSGYALLTGLSVIMGLGLGLGFASLGVIVQDAAPAGFTSDVSGLTREGGYVAQALGVAVCGGVMIAVLVSSLNSKIDDSTGLSAAQKQTIVSTLDKDVEVSVVTDAQAQTVAKDNGADQATAAEIVTINGQARNEALTVAMLVISLAALLGFLFALRIPASATGSEP